MPDFGDGQLDPNIHYDANDQPVSVAIFDDATPDGIASLATSPTTGGLYAVDIVRGQVYRIAYQSSAQPAARGAGAWRRPPSARHRSVCSSRAAARPTPRARRSATPGASATAARRALSPIPSTSTSGPVGVPTTYTATLTVRDPQNQTSTAQVRVYVNDTPPQVTITSPASQGDVLDDRLRAVPAHAR